MGEFLPYLLMTLICALQNIKRCLGGRIIYPEGQRHKGGSLPCPRNLLTPLTGNKEGSKGTFGTPSEA